MKSSPKTIDDRLTEIERNTLSIQVMLATVLNKLSATPDHASSMNEFIAAGKSQGLSMVEILNRWNARNGTTNKGEK